MTDVATTLRTAYLAGPMRGIEDYNFPEFRKQAAWLRGSGWTIFSPAERDEEDPDIDHTEDVAGWSGTRGLDYFMQYDLAAVCRMHAVICLPGWEDSQGARLETMVATEVRHPVFEIVKDARSRRVLMAVSPDYIKVIFAERSLNVLKYEEGVPVEEEEDPYRSVASMKDVDDKMRATDEEEEEVTLPAGYVMQGGIPTWVGDGNEDVPLVSNDPTEVEAYLAAGDRDITRESYAADGTLSISALPTDSAGRKAVPIASGVLDYFPAALVEVARVSKAGNDKHNPGEALHHARGKSTDHADSLLRHLIDRGKVDQETGQRHSAEVAWRALALLQQELEDAGAPLARGARLPNEHEEFNAT
jgi:hypothetical protein